MNKLFVVAAVVIASLVPPFSDAGTNDVVAVLPLAAADTGIPYGLLPKPDELNAMTAQLRAGLAAGGVALVVEKRLASAVSAAGFDQTVPDRSCVEAECAQKIGREVHAYKVVVGSVTREMAVIWGTDLSVVDVRTGKITKINVGYKGDVLAMERGERYVGNCIARIIKQQKPCPPDPGW